MSRRFSDHGESVRNFFQAPAVTLARPVHNKVHLVREFPARTLDVLERHKLLHVGRSSSSRLRITCFWQHDLRAIWNFGSSSSLSQQLASMALGLFKIVIKRGTRIPLLAGYGNGVSIERVRFETDREALTLDYSIIPEDDDRGGHPPDPETSQGLDELHAIREHRRLTRTVEFSIPFSEGWDIQLSTRASSE
ncbi:hypothetical protein EW146_g10462, partial [Bondarzewia mesenterica]